jgi:type I restriction enzyme S subunit
LKPKAIVNTELLVRAKQLRYRGLLDHFATQYRRHRTEFGKLVDLISDRIQPDASGTSDRSIELENIESRTGRILGAERVNGDSALRSKFVAGDTLFGKLRPYLRKVARPKFDGICSTEMWVLRAKPKRLNPELLFHLVQTDEFQSAATKQSGSRMPRADWDLVSATPVPCPSDLTHQSTWAVELWAAIDDVHSHMHMLDALRTQKQALIEKLMTNEGQLEEKNQ